MFDNWTRWLLALLLLRASPAQSALEGPGAEQVIRAGRAEGPIDIDGRPDEAAWAAAPVFDGFVQAFPDEGAPPGARTELRVLYDDDSLYASFVCHDASPGEVIRRLARRDSPPTSDFVGVAIDSAHDHRTAMMFAVTAAGVQRDILFFDGSNNSPDWDATWDAAVAERPDGWSAELRIPLRILRFTPADSQRWGLLARRMVARRNERLDSVLIPQKAHAFVERFGHLELGRIAPRPSLELSPYAAARLIGRPRFSDPSLPRPRLVDPTADLGLDLRAQLASDLSLAATVNPDFGQVEADEVVLNLTSFEQFLPEKRPFFIEGMDLFQPPISPRDGTFQHQLFYSRRIGLSTPILAAAKLTGQATRRLEVGLLDAFASGAFSPATPEPDRRIDFHPEQPLHLAPNDALPAAPPARQNYLTAVGRYQVSDTVKLGAWLTSTREWSRPCGDEERALPPERRPSSCSTPDGDAAAVHWDVRTRSGDWALQGQLAGSRAGDPVRVLRDGTELRAGKTGAGMLLRGGKVGGEPLRFELGFDHATPTFDLSASGFLPTQNRELLSANAGVFQARMGPLLNLDARLFGSASFSAEARRLPRGASAGVIAEAILPGFTNLSCAAGGEDPQFDVREVAGAGVAVERQPSWFFDCSGSSNKNRRLWVGGSFHLARFLERGVATEASAGAAKLSLTVTPHPAVESKLLLSLDQSAMAARWIGRTGGAWLFGNLRSRALSVTLRQQLVLSPRVSLQAYAQLFAASGIYGPFFEAPFGSSTILLGELTPADATVDPSFQKAAFNATVVLRWEYRLGSTFFLVYTRAQRELPGGGPPLDRLPRGPSTDVLAAKWTYLF